MSKRELYIRILLIIFVIYSIYINKKYVIPCIKKSENYEKYKWYRIFGITVISIILLYSIYILFIKN